MPCENTERDPENAFHPERRHGEFFLIHRWIEILLINCAVKPLFVTFFNISRFWLGKTSTERRLLWASSCAEQPRKATFTNKMYVVQEVPINKTYVDEKSRRCRKVCKDE